MQTALVGIVMGSESDYETMSAAEKILADMGVPYEIGIKSAHRTPHAMYEYATTAVERGLKVIIAGAGGAAHLPGMISSMTTLPVLGVPVQSRALSGLDSLLSIVQMPGGVPTATFAIGTAGATNAGLFAVQILALSDPKLARKLSQYKEKLAAKVSADDKKMSARGSATPVKSKATRTSPVPRANADRTRAPKNDNRNGGRRGSK